MKTCCCKLKNQIVIEKMNKPKGVIVISDIVSLFQTHLKLKFHLAATCNIEADILQFCNKLFLLSVINFIFIFNLVHNSIKLKNMNV